MIRSASPDGPIGPSSPQARNGPRCEPGAVRGRVCDRRGRVRLLSGYIPGIAGERFPELAATLEHLDRCDAQIAMLTVGTRTRDVGLGTD